MQTASSLLNHYSRITGNSANKLQTAVNSNRVTTSNFVSLYPYIYKTLGVNNLFKKIADKVSPKTGVDQEFRDYQIDILYDTYGPSPYTKPPDNYEEIMRAKQIALNKHYDENYTPQALINKLSKYVKPQNSLTPIEELEENLI